MGHHFNRAAEAAERFPPRAVGDGRTGAVPVLPGARGDDAARGACRTARTAARRTRRGWDMRVVPNKFPALQVEGTLDREGEGMFDRMNGIGAHEVIIETPDHDQIAGADVGAGDRAGAVGVPRTHARPEAGSPAAATSSCSRTTARRPARRSSIRTRSSSRCRSCPTSCARRSKARGAITRSRSGASSATSCTRSCATAGA